MPLSQNAAKYFLSRQNMRPYRAFVSSYRYYSGTNINIIFFHLRLARQSFELLNFQLQQHEETCLVVADMIFFQTSGLLNPAVKSADAHFIRQGFTFCVCAVGLVFIFLQSSLKDSTQ